MQSSNLIDQSHNPIIPWLLTEASHERLMASGQICWTGFSWGLRGCWSVAPVEPVSKKKQTNKRNPRLQNKGCQVLHHSQGGACVGRGCQAEALPKKSIKKKKKKQKDTLWLNGRDQRGGEAVADWRRRETRRGGGAEVEKGGWLGAVSLLIRAAAVQRVNHEGQVRPRRHHGITRLHHLKSHVVERPDDGYWWGKKDKFLVTSLRLCWTGLTRLYELRV